MCPNVRYSCNTVRYSVSKCLSRWNRRLSEASRLSAIALEEPSDWSRSLNGSAAMYRPSLERRMWAWKCSRYLCLAQVSGRESDSQYSCLSQNLHRESDSIKYEKGLHKACSVSSPSASQSQHLEWVSFFYILRFIEYTMPAQVLHGIVIGVSSSVYNVYKRLSISLPI